jgi:hypothetical protein
MRATLKIAVILAALVATGTIAGTAIAATDDAGVTTHTARSATPHR